MYQTVCMQGHAGVSLSIPAVEKARSCNCRSTPVELQIVRSVAELLMATNAAQNTYDSQPV